MRNRAGASSVFADEVLISAKASARPLRELGLHVCSRPTAAAGVKKAMQNDGRALSKRRLLIKRRGAMTMAVTRASPA